MSGSPIARGEVARVAQAPGLSIAQLQPRQPEYLRRRWRETPIRDLLSLIELKIERELVVRGSINLHSDRQPKQEIMRR